MSEPPTGDEIVEEAESRRLNTLADRPELREKLVELTERGYDKHGPPERFDPIRDWLYVELIDLLKHSGGGVVITQASAEEFRPAIGWIVRCGKDVGLELRAGLKIAFNQFSAQRLQTEALEEDSNCRCIRYEDVWGIFRNASKERDQAKAEAAALAAENQSKLAGPPTDPAQGGGNGPRLPPGELPG